MDRNKIPAAAFKWEIVRGDKQIVVNAYPLKYDGVLVWKWSISDRGRHGLPYDLWREAREINAHDTGRNLSDTPQDALDSLSDEQMDVLEKLIDWVRGEG